MANTITKQTIVDGVRNLVVKVHLNSDSTEETAAILINASDYNPPYTQCNLMALDYSMTGDFSGKLMWDADANVDIIALSNDQAGQKDFSKFGGIPNNAGSGRTGDILLETTGIASADEITLIFHIRKKRV